MILLVSILDFPIFKTLSKQPSQALRQTSAPFTVKTMTANLLALRKVIWWLSPILRKELQHQVSSLWQHMDHNKLRPDKSTSLPRPELLRHKQHQALLRQQDKSHKVLEQESSEHSTCFSICLTSS